jgi:chromosome partitioning protein
MAQIVEPSIGQLPGENVFKDLLKDEGQLRTSLDKHMLSSFAPEKSKELRFFSSAEVSALLGLSNSHLRKMHFDGKIPQVHADSRGHKQYSSKDLFDIRVALAQNSKSPQNFLPGRVGEEHMQVIAVTTFKGGSGKTTSTAHLAQALNLRGYRVLVCDLDPQGSLSSMFGLRPELELDESVTLYDAIRYNEPVPIRDIIQQTYFHNLDIAPGGLILSEYETETPHAMRQGITPPFYLRLREALDQVSNDYDVALIDCPPQLGFLTMSALVASTGIVIPVIPNMIDVASLSQYLTMATSLLKVVEKSGQNLNFDFMRYVLCRYEPSDTPQSQMASFLRMHFGPRLMTETFVKSTAVSDAGLRQNTLYEAVRGDITRSTLDRALESFNGVADELDATIKAAWGRE